MRPILIVVGKHLLQGIGKLLLLALVAILTTCWVIYTGHNWLVVAICLLIVGESLRLNALFLLLRNRRRTLSQLPVSGRAPFERL
jgi:hypothetical protein